MLLKVTLLNLSSLEADEKSISAADSEDRALHECKPRPFWQLLTLGAAAGAGGGLLGVGGGIIMIPVMTLWGYSQKCAQGTSLAVISAIAPLAIFTYARLGNVDWGFAVPLALGGLIGAEIGTRIALRQSNRTLSSAFSVLLILVALRLLFFRLPEASAIHSIGIVGLTEAGLLGVVAGAAAGFFGVGGGIVFVPTGVLLAGLSQVVAQGSSYVAILPTALLCAYRYNQGRELGWHVVKWLVPGALAGVVVGAVWADLLPGAQLKTIFALYLLYTGIQRLLKERNHSL